MERNFEFDPNDIIREQEFNIAEGMNITAICYESGERCKIAYWLNKTDELYVEDITKEYDIGLSSATLEKKMSAWIIAHKDAILSGTPW